MWDDQLFLPPFAHSRAMLREDRAQSDSESGSPPLCSLSALAEGIVVHTALGNDKHMECGPEWDTVRRSLDSIQAWISFQRATCNA